MQTIKERISRRAFVAGAASLAAMGAAKAQGDYPARAVKIVVPTGAGAAIDTVARGLAQRLEQHLKVPFVIENKPGANSTIGADTVARSQPDGYTLLYTGQAISVNPSLYKTNYDAQTSFSPIATVATAPITLAVPADSPYKSVKELIAGAKAKPGALTYGSAGRGSPPDLSAQLFQRAAGVSFIHVPYKGAAEAMTDVLGSRLDLMFPSLTLAKGFIGGGRLRVLGIAEEKRSELAPDIPTIAEEGLPGFSTTSWSGLVAPANTPSSIVTLLTASIQQILNDAAMKNYLYSQGLEPAYRGPDEFKALIRTELKNWSEILKKPESN